MGKLFNRHSLTVNTAAADALVAAPAPPYDDLPPFKTLEALASDTIRAIKRIQPKGPYNLLGWSFGARLAYEIAQQLQAQGDEVA